VIATAVVTVMYLGLCDSIAEMSPALPHTGGAYSFGRTAMGPWGGFVTGLAENMEYVLTPAVIVVGIGGYLGAVFGTPEAFAPAWWLLAYVAFVGLNVWGVYFPKWLSLTHRRRETPHVALVTGAVIGFLVALALHFTPRDGPVGAALLNMAVFGAVIAYVMQMLAFVLLRRRLPHIERPYRSRAGVTGAVLSGGIALVVLLYLLAQEGYRAAIVGCIAWFLVGLIYFAVFGRRHLVLSPEEDLALRNRQ